jgi:beta-phosphoglucomutase family hydrolase
MLAGGLALIFDMDGVIIDSNPLHREAWAAYNLRFGIETSEEMQRLMYGRRNDEIVRGFFGDHLSEAEVAAHGAAKEALYREMMAGSLSRAMVPGIQEFLEAHACEPLALASNAETANVDFLLDRLDLRRFFRAVVDGHKVAIPKPHPEVYLRAADLVGIEPANCIVFEDSEAGVAAARAAGMRTAGVTTTHGELPGVELLIRDFHDPGLEPWLRNQAVAR